jgi:folate-binding protein YgfZ
MESVVGYEYEPAAHLLATDEDAADFLQSQFTNDLRPVEEGRSTYGLWLDVKGKVVADSFVLCEGDERFRVLSEASQAETLAEKLERHIIADDVEIEVMPAGRAIALVGASAVAVLEALDLAVPDEGCFVQSAGVRVFRGRRALEANFELWAETAALASRLKARLLELSVEFVAEERMHALRMAAGIPSVPVEIGPADLPGEGALVGDAVSLSKGCYLGQEVVSRMHNVGSPQRALFRMSGSGAVPVCPVALYQGTKKVGELRSAFSLGARWQGVAILKTRFAVVGEALTSATGSAAVEGLFSVVQEETE